MLKKILKVLLSAVILTVISQIIHTVGSLLTMSYYYDEKYYTVWSLIMMPTAGPPPSSFYFYSLLFAFVNFLIFSTVFLLVKPALKINVGKSAIKQGLLYSLIVFLLAGISSTLMLILLINLPATLIVWWMFESLIIYLLGGLVVSGLEK